MKVWIVTESMGSYDDRTENIVAVKDSKAKAQGLVDEAERGYFAQFRESIQRTLNHFLAQGKPDRQRMMQFYQLASSRTTTAAPRRPRAGSSEVSSVSGTDL